MHGRYSSRPERCIAHVRKHGNELGQRQMYLSQDRKYQKDKKQKVIRRKDTQRPSEIEPHQVYPVRTVVLGREQAGDEKSRDHEKDPYTQVARIEQVEMTERVRQMARDHQGDRDGSEAVERRYSAGCMANQLLVYRRLIRK